MAEGVIDQLDALEQAPAGAGEFARLWRERRFDRMECLSARFRSHIYTPHTHDTYVIGVIVGGVERYRYRGTEHLAPAGSVLALDPGELHDGRPAEDGYAYRMFYPSPTLFEGALADALERRGPLPHFREAMLPDRQLYEALRTLHSGLDQGGAEPLRAETDLLRALVAASVRHGNLNSRLRPVGREPLAVRRARDYLDAHLDTPVELADLAGAVGLSRFHLLRVFRAAVGTTPHTYLTDRRVARAKELLDGTLPLAEVAASCGFADQSHLNRVFKARVGVSPGQYRRGSNPVQDGTIGAA